MKQTKILLVAHDCPWPPDIGLKTHLHHMIEALRSLGELHVFGFHHEPDGGTAWRDYSTRAGFQLAGLARTLAGLQLRRNQAACLLRGQPLVDARYQLGAARRQIVQTLEVARASGEAFDWIAFEVFPTIQDLPASIPVRRLLFPVDCYSLYYERIRDQSASALEWIRSSYLRAACARMERVRYSPMDVIATVAEPDAARLRHLLPEARIEVVPVPVQKAAVARARTKGARPRVLAAGYFGMPTIAADMKEFLRSWSALEGPGADLIVWGRGARQAGLETACRQAGADLVEWTADYEGLLSSGDIYVYPQRFACGVQTKIQQAMSAGLAVVAGPAVLEPLGAQPGRHARLAHTPAEAAAEVRRLIAEPQETTSLGLRAQELMQERFSPAAIARKLAEIMDLATAHPVRVPFAPLEDHPSDFVLHR